MWTNQYIENQLKFRLKPVAEITTKRGPHSRGNYTQFYYYKNEKLLVYNYEPEGNLTGNFVISSLVKDDPKGAIEFDGRKGKGTFGKKLVLKKCGATDMEKFNYISELLYQAIKNFQ